MTDFSKSHHHKICTHNRLKGGVTYVHISTRARVRVQSVGGGLVIEANIPVQELEGQRGEGAYFREDTVLVCSYVCCGVIVSVRREIFKRVRQWSSHATHTVHNLNDN